MARLRNHLAGLVLAVTVTGGLVFIESTPRSGDIAVVGFGGYLAGLALHMWFKTTLYWYRRGTSRAKYWNCENCNNRIYRKSGDWITTCHECGWRPGYPVIRWLWHSVPAVEARRRFWITGLIRVSIPALAVAGLLVAGIAGPSALPIQEVNNAVESFDDDDHIESPSISATPTPTAADVESAISSSPSRTQTRQPTTTRPTTPSTGDLDREAIEYAVHREINERRKARGHSPLDFDSRLRAIARAHSQHMAVDDFFSHTEPDGDDMFDRYRQHGYDCRVPTSGNRYLQGAENIAYTYAYRNIIRSDGTSVNYDGDEKAIAEGLVYQWMHSTGHRENILTSEWRREGIGIFIEDAPDGTRVYATQNFC